MILFQVGACARLRRAQAYLLLWCIFGPQVAYASAFDPGGTAGAAHAMGQVSAVTWFIYAMSAFTGFVTVGVSITKAIKNVNTGNPDGGLARPLFAACIGGAMVVLPVMIEIFGRTAYGDGAMPSLGAFAIDTALAETLIFASVGLASYLPDTALITLIAVLFIIGLVSIYFGFRKAYTAVQYGSESNGTNLHHKLPAIILHIVLGLALLAPLRVHCLVATTFNQPQLCVY